jgi:hypothetical protein
MALARWPARQGQQRSLRRMRQVLSWAFAFPGSAQPGVGLVRFFLGGGLAPAAVGRDDRLAGAVIPLVRQDDQARSSELADDPPDPCGSQVMSAAAQRPGDPHDVPAG